jgi:FKBP-type peptidyl-prolyl cis-trans isomerase FklB
MNIRIISLATLLVVSATGYIQAQTKAKKPVSKTTTKPTFMLKTQADKFSYAVGMNIAQGIKQQGFADSVNVPALAKALEDVIKGKSPLLSEQDAQMIIQTYFQAQQSKAGGKNAVEGQKFLEDNKKKPGVVVLPSGLQYQILKEGNGELPKATDKVTTHYHGTLINGEVFDSSVDRGQPASFPVNGVIQGWQEALQLMKVGSKWKLFVPSELAYGNQGAGPKIGPGTALIFEVELISIDN